MARAPRQLYKGGCPPYVRPAFAITVAKGIAIPRQRVYRTFLRTQMELVLKVVVNLKVARPVKITIWQRLRQNRKGTFTYAYSPKSVSASPYFMPRSFCGRYMVVRSLSYARPKGRFSVHMRLGIYVFAFSCVSLCLCQHTCSKGAKFTVRRANFTIERVNSIQRYTRGECYSKRVNFTAKRVISLKKRVKFTTQRMDFTMKIGRTPQKNMNFTIRGEFHSSRVSFIFKNVNFAIKRVNFHHKKGEFHTNRVNLNIKRVTFTQKG